MTLPVVTRYIEREECSVCGSEVRGNTWSCTHTSTYPLITGQRQSPTPTVKRTYVSELDYRNLYDAYMEAVR